MSTMPIRLDYLIRIPRSKPKETVINPGLVFASGQAHLFPLLSEETLSSLASYGIISANEYRRYEIMAKKEKVLRIHTHAVSQGKGKDGRRFTHVRDPRSGKRKRMAARTEEELYLKLYDYYYTSARKKKKLTLRKVYPDWLKYRYATAGKANSVHRQDTDYRHFYLQEPLSQKLLDISLFNLTRADVKQWECELIRKYGMSYKQATNIFSILKQLLDYLKGRTERGRQLEETAVSSGRFSENGSAAPKPSGIRRVFRTGEKDPDYALQKRNCTGAGF